MNDRQLRSHLEQLHTELRQTRALDDDEKELLQDLEKEIRELLDRKETHERHYAGLGGRLQNAVTKLEVSHPRTTLLMRQVIDTLGYLGI